MKLTEVITSKTQTILNEGWQDLNETQQNYLSRFELELWPLVESYAKLSEAELTSVQIQSIFKGAEETAMASGDNKTALGKVGAAAKLPVDLAKKVDAKINELGKLAQQAGPIKNADAKFEELKKKIGDGDSKISAGVKKISDWAKANPGKASLAVGILTTIAAFAGGPLGGAAAGLILRSTKDLLQGEKLSSAVGKSVKTAAYGALAGAAFKYISSEMVDNIATAQVSELDAMEAAMKSDNFITAKADLFADLGMDVDALDGAVKMKLSGNLNGFFYNYDSVIPPDMMSQYKALEAAVDGAKSFSPEHYKAAGEFHNFMGQLVRSDSAKDLTAAWNALKEIPRDSLNMDQLRQIITSAESGDVILKNMADAGGAIAAAAQGAMQTVDDTAKDAQKAKPIDPEEKEQLELDLKGGSDATPVDKNFDKGQKMSDFGATGDKAESIDYENAFGEYLQEADPVQGELGLDNPNTLGAKMKRGAGNLASKAAGAVKQGAGAVKRGAKGTFSAVKQGAKDVGNKVTANKLNKDWKKAGEPTDSGSIVNILSGAGLTNDQISSIAGSTQAPISPDEVTKADAQASTDGAVDATQAPTAGDNTKATQAQATTKNDKQEPSSTTAPGETPKAKGGPSGGGVFRNKGPKPKIPGGAKATSANAIPGLAQKIKKAGVEAQVKKMLGNTGGTQQGGTQQGGTQQGGEVSLPDLATKIANAGVQKQVRAMLVRG